MTRLVLDPSALDDVGRALIEEGRRALPDPYGDGTEHLLPQRKHRGRCRVCGEQADLTKEHIPPAAALNLVTTAFIRLTIGSAAKERPSPVACSNKGESAASRSARAATT